MTTSLPPSPSDDKQTFDLNSTHGHKDLVQAVAFNTYGDRCATGSVDGKIRVFNRHKDGVWRLCDVWGAHGGEVLELQWLPATIYPNLIASLGMEGWFRLWAEDPSAPPGRRFCSGRSVSGRPAFDTRSTRAPYRSFSVKHNEETRHTYLALLAGDGRLTIYENDQPEDLTEYTSIDEFNTCPKPARGEEVSFKVVFDPNPEPCYTALRAGVTPDSLGLVVAGMNNVKVYRSREIAGAAYGVDLTRKEFYLAVEISGHRGLVRDLSWAPGNVRGYDVIATACQDGYARVFRIDTPYSADDGKSWSSTDLLKSHKDSSTVGNSGSINNNNSHNSNGPNSSSNTLIAGTNPSSNSQSNQDPQQQQQQQQQQSAPPLPLHNPPPNQHPSYLSASLAKSGSHADRHWSGEPGQVKHTYREISKLADHHTPVWRVGFDDDGQILGTTGDDGRLLCFRQLPDGTWAKSSEVMMLKTKGLAPPG